MNNAIGRVSAEQDLRAVSVGINIQSGENAKSLSDRLVIEMGEVLEQEGAPRVEERDEVGFAGLKAMC